MLILDLNMQTQELTPNLLLTFSNKVIIYWLSKENKFLQKEASKSKSYWASVFV